MRIFAIDYRVRIYTHIILYIRRRCRKYGDNKAFFVFLRYVFARYFYKFFTCVFYVFKRLNRLRLSLLSVTGSRRNENVFESKRKRKMPTLGQRVDRFREQVNKLSLIPKIIIKTVLTCPVLLENRFYR